MSDVAADGSRLVLSSDQLAAQEQAFAALKRLIQGRTTLLFAGAGVSKPAGYPLWIELLSELEAICGQCGPGFVPDPELRESDPLLYADRVKRHIEAATGSLKRYHKHLLKRFLEEPIIQQFHRDIIDLPFRGFITTNYDRVLEATLSTKEPSPLEKSVVVGVDPGYIVHEYMRSLISSDAPRLVAHLHGYYRNPASIVLAASDFTATYGSREEAKAERPVPNFLRHILATWSLVFVGFSFSDPHLGVFLRAASNESELWGDGNHFALIDTTPETLGKNLERARAYREEYGIETVFYEKRGQSHVALYNLVANLSQAISLPKRSPVLDAINDRMSEEMRD